MSLTALITFDATAIVADDQSIGVLEFQGFDKFRDRCIRRDTRSAFTLSVDWSSRSALPAPSGQVPGRETSLISLSSPVLRPFASRAIADR